LAKRILVTSALPYANGPIHLGHLAGAYLPADLYVRFKRLQGKDILFICGSDEHGVPITLAAEDQEVAPQDIVDKYHNINKKIFENFEISFDYYGRTSSETHYQTTQDFFKKLYDDDVFERKTQEQLYDEEMQMFLPDRYVTGTCPNCGYEEAYGDQCENCGKSLSPTDLINPRSVLTGNTPITKETEHFYLPLGDYQEQFEEWLDTRKNWKPNVMGQVKSWLNEGLSDRAMTRDLTWGVPVPVEGFEDKVMYVWFDAPIGYISATREWAKQNGDSKAWKKYWQDEETNLIHFIGKDNIVFHCIIFPILLMLHGDYVLPENVPANEFLNLEEHKFSTSRNWAVWLDDYLDDFEPDLLRYVLATILPETKDSNFSWEDFQNKVNNELADILGNFVHRTISFTRNFAGGQLPELKNPITEDRTALAQIEIQKEKIADNYNTFHIREAVAETMKLARIGNKYFTETEPWHTRKTDKTACENTLHVCLQLCAALSILFDPVMPAKMQQLRSQLGVSGELSWEGLSDEIIEPGQAIEKDNILFPKIEDEMIEKQINKLNTEPDIETNYEPLKDEISFDDFQKMDIRTGVILKAGKVKKSNKLLEINVDLGFEERTIVSGIANHFDADSLTGQKVCVVANLAPKQLFGIKSNGMILMAEDAEGNLEFVEANANPGDPVL
jgi:methionyl-tRNA synthetase